MGGLANAANATLDITATVEGRATMLDVVKRVSEAATVPFTVGGGIRDVASASAVLEAGADKVSVSTAAFHKPEIIEAMVKEFGTDKVTVAIDVDQNNALPSGYEVYVDGGRTATTSSTGSGSRPFATWWKASWPAETGGAPC